MSDTYSQKLNHPDWFELRKSILERDEFRCRDNSSHGKSLEVHHLHYEIGREPWDYPPENFLTLCSRCHKRRHDLTDPRSSPLREPGSFFTWSQIENWIGAGFKPFLNDNGNEIDCGTFKMPLNPDAPDIILPGKAKSIWKNGCLKLAEQGNTIPVFVKAEGLPWEYAGMRKVEAIVTNRKEVELHESRTRRLSKHGYTDRSDDVVFVVFLD